MEPMTDDAMLAGMRQWRTDLLKWAKTHSNIPTKGKYVDGWKNGRKWAEGHATASQLHGVSLWVNEPDHAWPWWEKDQNGLHPYSPADDFARAAGEGVSLKNSDPVAISKSKATSASFWEKVLGPGKGNQIEDEDFLRGFGDAVAEAVRLWGVRGRELTEKLPA